jgi:hypothetical protein
VLNIDCNDYDVLDSGGSEGGGIAFGSHRGPYRNLDDPSAVLFQEEERGRFVVTNMLPLERNVSFYFSLNNGEAITPIDF